MLGTFKNRMLEGGKQLKNTLEEHSAEMNQRIQMNININSASEKFNAVAAAATNVVTTVTKSTTSQPSNPTIGKKEPDEVSGGPFFASFVHRQEQVLIGHNALMESGEKLSDIFSKTRQRVTSEAQSVMYLEHNFQEITKIQAGIRSIRDSIQSLVLVMEEVEKHLMTKTEEYIVYENASYALEQQAELEQYEHEALVEKESRIKKRHEARQRALGEAFAKDLKAYQNIVTYQGQVPSFVDRHQGEISLETIDLTIQPDTDLEIFYQDNDEILVDQVTAIELHELNEEEETKSIESNSQHVHEPLGNTLDESVPDLPSEIPTLRQDSD